MGNRYLRLFYAVFVPVALLLGFNNCAGNDFALIEESSVELESKRCKINPSTDILAEQFEDGDHFVTTFVRPELEDEHTHQKIYYNGSSDPTNAPRWKTAGNVIEWRYNPAGAPSNLASQMLNLIQTSMNNWSKVCNIKFKYLGATSLSSNSGQVDGTNVFGWGTASGNTGIAYTYILNTVPIGTLDEGDVQFSSTLVKTTEQVLATANHEIGHLIGLDHSNVQASIMFANPYNSISYLQTLRQDDIDGCIGLYGPPVTVAPTPSPTPTPTPTPTASPMPSPPPTATPTEDSNC